MPALTTITGLAAADAANLSDAVVVPVDDASGQTRKATLAQVGTAMGLVPAGRATGLTPGDYVANNATFNVKDVGGAVGDGTTNDTAAIAATIAAAGAAGGGRVTFPAGTFCVDQIDVDEDNVVLEGAGVGRTVLQVRTASTASFAVLLDGRTRVLLRDFTLDVNGVARNAGMAGVEQCNGVVLLGCTDCGAERVRVTGVYGAQSRGGFSGGSFSADAASVRCGFDTCVAIDSGDATNKADGFYVGGSYCRITNCHAENCTDTAWVVENGSRCLVDNFSAINCGSSGACTLSGTGGSADRYGNVISNITAEGSQSGLLFGCAGTGNLYGTVVTNVVQRLTSPPASQPALNLLKLSTGQLIDATFSNVSLDGAGTFGVNARGTDVRFRNLRVRNNNASFPAFQAESTERLLLDGVDIVTAAAQAMIFSACTDSVVRDPTIDATHVSGVGVLAGGAGNMVLVAGAGWIRAATRVSGVDSAPTPALGLFTVITDAEQAGSEAFETGTLLFGGSRLRVDSAGTLRTKTSAFTGDTDGTVVGTQT